MTEKTKENLFKMVMYNMSLKSKYFNMILSGDKKYEIRLNDEKRRRIKILDIINFCSDDGRYVSNILYFNSFENLIDNLDNNLILPGHTKEEILNVYHGIEGYKEEAKIYGIVAFELVNINTST